MFVKNDYVDDKDRVIYKDKDIYNLPPEELARLVDQRERDAVAQRLGGDAFVDGDLRVSERLLLAVNGSLRCRRCSSLGLEHACSTRVPAADGLSCPVANQSTVADIEVGRDAAASGGCCLGLGVDQRRQGLGDSFDELLGVVVLSCTEGVLPQNAQRLRDGDTPAQRSRQALVDAGRHQCAVAARSRRKLVAASARHGAP
jgi:hypothetical protein